jgi:hypothetical protein
MGMNQEEFNAKIEENMILIKEKLPLLLEEPKDKNQGGEAVI